MHAFSRDFSIIGPVNFSLDTTFLYNAPGGPNDQILTTTSD